MIDYENVQLDGLAALDHEHFKVIVLAALRVPDTGQDPAAGSGPEVGRSCGSQ